MVTKNMGFQHKQEVYQKESFSAMPWKQVGINKNQMSFVVRKMSFVKNMFLNVPWKHSSWWFP